MNNRTSSDFTIITQENIVDVARALETQKGMIVIPRPEYYTPHELRLTGRFTIHLFGDARLNSENRMVLPTHLMKNRQYRLIPHRVPPDLSRLPADRKELYQSYYGAPADLDARDAQAETLFQRLMIDNAYEFTIAPEHGVGYGLVFPQASAIFIPTTVSPQGGLLHVFRLMMSTWNEQEPLEGVPLPFRFTVDHVDTLVNYALKDLQTGEILRHNIDADRQANKMVGFN